LFVPGCKYSDLSICYHSDQLSVGIIPLDPEDVDGPYTVTDGVFVGHLLARTADTEVPIDNRDEWKSATHLPSTHESDDYNSTHIPISQTLESIRGRVVFRSWPRDPKGTCISLNLNNSLPGKMTSNGLQPWGASLGDFYHVQRVPDFDGFMMISMGSKLAAWMKANGELDFAKAEIEKAEMEENPREVPPCGISDLIEDLNPRLVAGDRGQSMQPAAEKKGQVDGKGKGKVTVGVYALV